MLTFKHERKGNLTVVEVNNFKVFTPNGSDYDDALTLCEGYEEAGTAVDYIVTMPDNQNPGQRNNVVVNRGDTAPSKPTMVIQSTYGEYVHYQYIYKNEKIDIWDSSGKVLFTTKTNRNLNKNHRN